MNPLYVILYGLLILGIYETDGLWVAAGYLALCASAMAAAWCLKLAWQIWRMPEYEWQEVRDRAARRKRDRDMLRQLFHSER